VAAPVLRCPCSCPLSASSFWLSLTNVTSLPLPLIAGFIFWTFCRLLPVEPRLPVHPALSHLPSQVPPIRCSGACSGSTEFIWTLLSTSLGVILTLKFNKLFCCFVGFFLASDSYLSLFFELEVRLSVSLTPTDHHPTTIYPTFSPPLSQLRDRALPERAHTQHQMATDFIMPRVSDQQQSAYMQQRQFYQQQQQQQQQQPYQQAPAPAPYQSSGQYNNQQVSPLSTSGNASPTSSKNYITRQVRPLYVPAVLRPTQFPSKAPTHRPKSLNEEAFEDRDLQQTNNGFIGLGGLGAFGRLSRRSTGDSGKCISDDWNFDLFPKPTGAPTRKHWKVCPRSHPAGLIYPLGGSG